MKPKLLKDGSESLSENLLESGGSLEDRSFTKKTVSKKKRYELRALGYCIEVTAHKLSAKELKDLKKYCQDQDIDLSGDLGNVEEILPSYNMYETNLWQSSTVPILGSTVYGLYDDQGREVFLLEDISVYVVDKKNLKTAKFFKSLKSIQEEKFIAKGGKGNVLLAFEEFKGTAAVWVIESEDKEVPQPSDFSFLLGKIITGWGKEDQVDFVSLVFYKGVGLDKDYDQEFIRGKAFYSKLV